MNRNKNLLIYYWWKKLFKFFIAQKKVFHTSSFQLCSTANSKFSFYNSLCEINRSCRPEVFSKKGVLRDLAKVAGNTCVRVSFLIKVAGLRHRCFSVNFVKFLRTLFRIEHLYWLLKAEILWVLFTLVSSFASEWEKKV